MTAVKREVIIGHSRLLLADCMDVMRDMPDKAFDLAIVDPPYGINISKNDIVGGRVLANPTVYGRHEWDKSSPDKIYFNRLLGISKNQIIWGANHFISKIPIDSSCWIVWDKANGTAYFADSELAWTSFKCAVRNFKFRWAGMLQGNMKDKESRIHPTQKPVALYSWLLTNYAKPGQTILDTHLGSGSSAIAANKLGFKFTGIELDEGYFNAACERVEDAYRQTSLFDGDRPFVAPEQATLF